MGRVLLGQAEAHFVLLPCPLSFGQQQRHKEPSDSSGCVCTLVRIALEVYLATVRRNQKGSEMKRSDRGVIGMMFVFSTAINYYTASGDMYYLFIVFVALLFAAIAWFFIGGD